MRWKSPVFQKSEQARQNADGPIFRWAPSAPPAFGFVGQCKWLRRHRQSCPSPHLRKSSGSWGKDRSCPWRHPPKPFSEHWSKKRAKEKEKGKGPLLKAPLQGAMPLFFRFFAYPERRKTVLQRQTFSGPHPVPHNSAENGSCGRPPLREAGSSFGALPEVGGL